MGGKGSGGHNAISVVEHLRAGTYRADRHGTRLEPPASAPITPAARRRVLRGLPDEARRLASALLDDYGEWDAASLTTLRLFAESAARLATITDDSERRRETRVYLSLLKALGIDR